MWQVREKKGKRILGTALLLPMLRSFAPKNMLVSTTPSCCMLYVSAFFPTLEAVSRMDVCRRISFVMPPILNDGKADFLTNAHTNSVSRSHIQRTTHFPLSRCGHFEHVNER